MKKIGIFLGIIIIVGVIMSLSLQNNPASQVSTETVNTNTSPAVTGQPTSGAPAMGQISMTEIAQHSSQQSCYTAIDGSVYDLTSWIPLHPGGRDAILYLCGKDGSAAFTQQHGGQERPEMQLEKYKIGTLATS